MNSANKSFYKSKKFLSLFGAILTILVGVPISSYANNQFASLGITLAVSILEAFYLYLQGNIDVASINKIIDNTLPIIAEISTPEIAKITEANKPLIEKAIDQVLIQPTIPVLIPVDNVSIPVVHVEIPVAVITPPTLPI